MMIYYTLNDLKGEIILSIDLKKEIVVPDKFSIKEEVVSKCEEWLELFKENYDSFKRILSSVDNGYILLFFDSLDSADKYSISLNLMTENGIVEEGANLELSSENDAIFGYLTASVLDYCLSNDFSGGILGLDNIADKGRNYSIISESIQIKNNLGDFYCRSVVRSCFDALNIKAHSYKEGVTVAKPDTNSVVELTESKIIDQQMPHGLISGIDNLRGICTSLNTKYPKGPAKKIDSNFPKN